jgi:hypothetical protein
MPKLSKAEKQRRNAEEFARILSGTAGFLVFVGIALSSDGTDSHAFTTSIIPAGVASVTTWIVLYILLYRIFKAIFVRRPEPKIDFEDAPISRHKQATEFEYEVADIIERVSGKRAEVVGGSGDKGVDIKVFDERGKLVGIAQCKRLGAGKIVYPAYIRDLNTVKHYHQVNIAYLVSTGRFSDESRQLAKELGIRLIDGHDLNKLRKRAADAVN